MSFMDTLKTFLGRNTDLWGTPESLFSKLLLVLLTQPLCFRFFRYQKTNTNPSIVKPYASSFLINKPCGIQPNTFDRSAKTVPAVKF